MKTPLLALLASSFFVLACKSSSTSVPKPEKEDAIARLCEDIGEPADCDICELRDWIGDGVCDDFCLTHDPDCGRATNPACASKELDEWIFECFELNNDIPIEEAQEFCAESSLEGPLLEDVESCANNSCLRGVTKRAQECSEGIAAEISALTREPNPACHELLDTWMFECFTENFDEHGLADTFDFCVESIENGEPLEEAGICQIGNDVDGFETDLDCHEELMNNAEQCASAMGDEFH
jgi:hypothetical protein